MSQQTIRTAAGDIAFLWDTTYGAPPRVLGTTLMVDKYKQVRVPILGPAAETPGYVSNRRARDPFATFGAEASSTGSQVGTLALLTAPAWLALLYVATR